MKLISVVAASENNVIGMNNTMPWHLPDDLKFFKKMTVGGPVIMGKNTWISIGARPLPKRANIVVSTTMPEDTPGAIVVHSFEAALDYVREHVPMTDGEEEQKVSLIGGGQLYRQVLDQCAEIYMTRVHTEIEEGTVFFPEIRNNPEWKKVWEEAHSKDEHHIYSFTFERWIKTNA
ncbi:Dihydrofolate reductase [compost metagenome]